jgi:mannose/fructose/N-acetylgalactosamine-specific phosphotransferase system component IID
MIKVHLKMFIRTFFIQALWNYERLQNVGFVFVLKPFLDKICLNEDRRKAALLRHMGYCNTHPYMVGLVIAIVANIENKMADGSCKEEIQEIDEVKMALYGPLSAIGDSFFGVTLRSAVSFVSVFMLIFIVKILNNRFQKYNVLIPLVFIVLYNVVHITVRYCLMFLGFRFGKKSICMLQQFKFILTFVRYSGLAIALMALVLYLYLLLVTKAYDVFACGVIFIFSIIVSRKFGVTFLFYGILLVCILMSCLEI